MRLDQIRRRGLPVALTLDEPATVEVRVAARFRSVQRGMRGRRTSRRRHRIATGRRTFDSAGFRIMRVKLSRNGKRRLRGRRQNLRLAVEVVVTDRQGNTDRFVRRPLLKPARRRRRVAGRS
jgi:hypothetical protein